MILAELGSLVLPPQFSYRPYVPQKRNTVQATANAVITQFSTPQIVHGDGSLAWSIDQGYPNEFQELWDLYNTPAPVEYLFKGYWGEQLIVYFTTLDPPNVRGTLFNMSGQFQVLSVVQNYNADPTSACA